MENIHRNHITQAEQQVIDSVSKILARLPIVNDRVGLPALTPFECALLNLVIEQETVPGWAIASGITERLLVVGRECYQQHVEHGEYPDHTTSPHALAFAIAKSAITVEEVNRIKFDHGDTVRSFYQGVEQDLVEKVWNSIVQRIAEVRGSHAYTCHLLGYVTKSKKTAA